VVIRQSTSQGQVATELLIILAVALGILLITFTVNSDVMQSVGQQHRHQTARTGVNDLGDAAELVYQQGVGSRTTVYLALPNAVASSTVSNKTIKIALADGESIYRNVGFVVNGTLPTAEGKYWVTVQAMEGYVLINASYATESPIVCGNGIIEAGEQCDLGQLGGLGCTDRGYFSGTLACYSNCTYDESSCSLADMTPPTVTLISPENGSVALNGSIVFNCYATDNVNLSRMDLWINISGAWSNYATCPISGTANSCLFDQTLASGGYRWNCNATDASGNSAFASNNFFLTVNIPPTNTTPIVVFSDWGWAQRILVLYGTNGTLKFTTSSPGYFPNTVAAGDLNNDGTDDIVGGMTNGNIITAFYGQNGTTLWSHTLSISGDSLKSPIIVAEGSAYAGGQKKKVYRLNTTLGNEIYASAEYANPYIETIDLGDIDGGGDIDFAVNSNSKGEIYAYNGTSGAILWTKTLSSTAKGTSALRVEDITGDGRADIAIGTNKDKVYLLSGVDGSEVWTSSTIGSDVEYIAVGDLNNDNTKDVLGMNGWGHYLYAFYGQNGSTMWYYNVDYENAYVLESADLNQDNSYDAIYGDDDEEQYHVLHGKNGSIMYSSASSTDDITHLVLGDLNQDGTLDVIVGGWDNKIRAYYGQNGSVMWTFTSTDNKNGNIAIGQVGT